MNQQTRDYGLRTPVNGEYLQTEFQGIYENFNNLDDTIGELTALRERIKSAIPQEALDLITAVNKIDEWLQTHTDNVSNPHNVGMSQLTNYNANNNKVTNLTAGTVSTDALNKGQLDSAVNTINTALAGKSNTGHGHAIADVSNLQSALDSKSPTSHNHSGVYQPVGDYSLVDHEHPQYITESNVSYITGLPNGRTAIRLTADSNTIDLVLNSGVGEWEVFVNGLHKGWATS